jgi:hypothetical protein
VVRSAGLAVEDCFPFLDVMLVMDRSKSMIEPDSTPYDSARAAATNFVRNLRLGTNGDLAGLASFNPTARLDQRLTNSAARAELASARHRSNAAPVVILLSDGVPHDFDTPAEALAAAAALKNAGTRVFTIGFGKVDPALMAAMASSTNDFFYTTNSADFTPVLDRISDIICRPLTNFLSPTNLAVCEGGDVVLTVTPAGCDAWTFAWSKDGVALGGETNAVLTRAAATAADGGIYSVVVSSACRVVTNSATVVVNPPAGIVSPVADTAGVVGSNATFTVGAAGTGLAYQWFFNGAVVGTNATLEVGIGSRQQAGEYCVVVSSLCGPAVTNCARLAVLNRAPAGGADAYEMLEDGVLEVLTTGVLGNDADPDLDAITSVISAGAARGVVTLEANGAFRYVPNTNFFGEDVFTYRVFDGELLSEEVVVTIRISGVPDAPVAADDFYEVDEDTQLNVLVPGVLGTDADPDGDALSVIWVGPPANGILDMHADGSFSYLPSPNFSGLDFFYYRCGDGALTSGVAVVWITVRPVDDRPVATNDTYTVNEDAPLIVAAAGVLLNDADPEGQPLTAELLAAPAHGTLVFAEDGAFTYSPVKDFTGTDTFTYMARDAATSSMPATVTIRVLPVNDPPVVRDDGGEGYSTYEDNALVVAAPGVLANDSDPDGDGLEAQIVSPPAHGTVLLNPDGSFTYTPAADYFGTDSFVYAATDGELVSSNATVSLVVMPVNDAPDFVLGPKVRVNFNSGAHTLAGFASGITAGPANEAGQIVQLLVSNDNPSLFSAQPAFSAEGELTFACQGTQIGSALVTVTARDDGSTDHGGVDSAVKTFVIVLNGPPVVNIIAPTNGSIFIGTNLVNVVADAYDPDVDGSVTNVQFWSGTNFLADVVSPPYATSVLLAPPKSYTFKAIATDDLGLTAESTVSVVTVLEHLPVVPAGPVALNRQNGLFEHLVNVTNPSPASYPGGVRIYITGLATNARVFNATGTNGGKPYIDVHLPLGPGGSVTALIQYYVPNPRVTPEPVLYADPLPFEELPGPPARIDLTVLRRDTNALVRFNALRDHIYYLQASSNLVDWTTLPRPILGGGMCQSTNSVQGSRRFFRVLQLQ